MGKFSAAIVFVSFAAFASLFLIGGDLFFKDLRIDPEEITGYPLPTTFEVEQSLDSKEGTVLVGIDRTNDLRVHFVRGSSEPETTTTENLVRAAKVYRTTGENRPDFLGRYLAAQVDPRRTEILEKIPVQLSSGEESSLLHVTAQSDKKFVIVLHPTERILFIAGHPKEDVEPARAIASLNSLGVTTQQLSNGSNS